MRLKQEISARVVLWTGIVVIGGLFATGRAVSASEQQGQTGTSPSVVAPQGAEQPSGPELRLTADEAVRLALENNLGVQAERLGPRISTLNVSQALGAYKPTLQSTTFSSSSTSPPDFLATGGSDAASTVERLETSLGVGQRLPWGGGNYSISWDATRQAQNFASTFNPTLGSRLSMNFVQPLLRNFRIDGFRQQLLVARKNEEIADVQLRQQLTVTERVVRNAYFDLVGALGQLQVAQQSLDLARQSLQENERRVEVGAMAQIDILEAQAEVSRVEEAVIVAEAGIRAREDALRTLILNPQQADYWSVRLVPTEQPTLTAQPIDVDTAVTEALANRTDLVQARKRNEATGINLDYARNQRLPDVNLSASYNTVGRAGTRYSLEGFPAQATLLGERAFSEALRDVFRNDFKSWTLQLQINYPLGQSAADANLAATRLQREQEQTNIHEMEISIAAQVRDAGRRVRTSLQRVEATQRARQFAERRLEAENKRVTVGLSTTFQLLQAQRDLATVRQQELNAIIDYNRALIDFQAVQQAPLIGR